MCERIGAKLEAYGARTILLAAFEMEHGALAIGGPQALAVPAGIGIIDAAIDVYREEAHRIGHGDADELAVDQREDPAVEIAHGDGHVFAKAEGVELVDPGVIARLGTAGVLDVAHLWTRKRIEFPAFGTMDAGGGSGSVQDLAFAAVRPARVPPGERRPVHLWSVGVHPPRTHA